MEIFYSNDTLYVNVDEINDNEIFKMKKRIYRILDDYNIDNVVLNLITDDSIESSLIDEFIKEYKCKYNSKIIMKKH